jgi:type I restriction enzyme S subunit
MNLPCYEEYKDSGVPWLGEVPAHWDVVRLRDVATVINGHPFDAGLFERDGLYPLIRIRDLDCDVTATCYNGPFIESAAVNSSDILIGMDGEFNVGRWLGNGPALLNQRMCCVRTDSQDLTRFLGYVLSIPLKAINDVTYATTVKHLSSFQVQKTRITLPPDLAELSAIATFLDRETAKIDDLVAEQRNLIGLLKEKRLALISHAVTKGLDPAAPMKDSGVEWLGMVPAHWEVLPIKLAARLESGHTPSRSHPEYWENCTVPWFTLADVWQIREGKSDRVFETKEQVSELGLANSSARLLPRNTVILSRTASVGFSAIMDVAMATTQDFVNWVCGPTLIPEFLLFILRSMQGEFRRIMMGSTHNTIYMPDIQALRFALPSLAEQQEIIEYVTKWTAQCDALITEAETATTLLQERRTALISAAVTGKIDVRRQVAVQDSVMAKMEAA